MQLNMIQGNKIYLRIRHWSFLHTEASYFTMCALCSGFTCYVPLSGLTCLSDLCLTHDSQSCRWHDYNLANDNDDERAFCCWPDWWLLGGEFVPPSIYPSYEHTDANAQTSTPSRRYWWWEEAVQILCQPNNDCKPFCFQCFQLNCPPL